MGILDLNNPQGMGLLSLGLRLMSTPGKFGTALGQAGMGALGDMQQIQAQNDTRKSRELQQQMLMMQLEQAKALQEAQRAQAQRQAKDEGLMRSMLTGTPVDGMGPPSMTPQLDPGAFVAGGGSVQGLPAMLQLQQALAPKPKKLMALSPGQVVLDEADPTKPLFSAPPKEDDFAAALRAAGIDPQSPQGRALNQQRVQKMASHAPASQQINYGSPVAGIGPDGKPVFFQPSKTGGAAAIVPNVRPPESKTGDKPLTEAQAKAATFQSQMNAAEQELATTPLDPTKVWNQADVVMAGGLTNFIASPAAQRARQAQEQWSEAFLRFKTGAAATKDEVILNVRTFFPQPGDSKEVIAQKKRARQQAVHDISIAAGKGAEKATQAGDDNDPLNLRGQ